MSFMEKTDIENPNIKIIRSIIIMPMGFLVAILGNLLFPQVANVEINKYKMGALIFTSCDFYRAILVVIILVFIIQGIIAYIDLDKREKYIKNVPFRIVLGIALLLYDIAGTKLQLTPQPFFPGPSQIVETYLIDGGIAKHLLYSLRLFICGFVLGVIFGVSVGVLIGWFKKAHYWIYPVIKIAGVIPAVAWMPFALTLFPTAFTAAVFLIVITALFPVASQTALGIQTTPKSMYEAARTLGADTPFLLLRVAIPHAMPQVFTGITTACASSFTILVMAEMMGQPGGLGYYINMVKVWSAYYKVFAAILLMAILFSLILAVLNLVKTYVLRWQKGQFK